MKEWERKGHFCLCDTSVGGGANREAEVSMSEKNQELLNGGVEGVHLDWSEKRKKVQIDWTGRSHGTGEQAGLDRSSTPPQILVAAITAALSLSLSLSSYLCARRRRRFPCRRAAPFSSRGTSFPMPTHQIACAAPA